MTDLAEAYLETYACLGAWHMLQNQDVEGFWLLLTHVSPTFRIVILRFMNTALEKVYCENYGCLLTGPIHTQEAKHRHKEHNGVD